MSSTTTRTLLFTLFIATFCLQLSTEVSAEVKAATASNSDYARDDYYYDDAEADGKDGKKVEEDDYEDDAVDEKEQMRPAELRAAPPYFVDPEEEIFTRPGEDVVIDCAVRNLQTNNVLMWYKGKVVIATGQFVMDPNVDVLKNNSLIIKNVAAKDAGDYYCEVLPEKIRMHAFVEVDETIMIYCDGNEVTNRSLVFRQGEPHHCECKFNSLENVQIKWFIDGKRAETMVERVLGDQLYIDNVDTIHGGIYQCLADDRSQEPPHAMIVVEVVYAPKVSTHRHYVNTELGSHAELYCDYNANPHGEVNWFRKDRMLKPSYKYKFNAVMHNARNRSILTILDVNANDLGEYSCWVKNNIGSGEANVHVIYEPEHPQLEGIEINGKKVTLQWLVRSVQPLSEAVLDYKLAGSYTWSKVSVVHTHRHPESHIWKVIHEIELTPGSWHVRMRAKNTVGWSKFSAQHDFVIKDDGNDDYEDDLDTGKAPHNMIAVASFGGGSKSANSSAAASISQTLVGVLFCCLIYMLMKVRV
ncbi:neurotrimin [Eurosta solidaginis]|uniref:neurotrimin n=1 Tax=Eurosta solidaginis TaxID=178769 RepID=UPI003530DFD0